MNFHLTLRYWKVRPARVLLSIASISVAVAAVFGTLAAQSTVRSSYRELMRTVEGQLALQIEPTAGGRFSPKDVPSLQGIPGIRTSFPLVVRPTAARVQRQRLQTLLLGIEPPAAESLTLSSGRHFDDSAEAILSHAVASRVGIQPGDRIVLITRRGPRTVTVVGLASPESLASVTPGASLVMPLKIVQDYYLLEDQVDRIRVIPLSNQQIATVRASLETILPKQLMVQMPVGQIELADSLLQSIELAMHFAGVLSAAMAGFLVLNTQRMSFRERRRELAVLRLLGATSGQIVALHLIEGAALGVIGSLLGIPLGMLLSSGLAQGMQSLLAVTLPAPQIPLSPILVALAVGPLIASLSAMQPAWQSRRISAIDATKDLEMRGADGYPLWIVPTSVLAWCLAAVLMLLVILERIAPELAIWSGVLMLISFILIVPVLLPPVVRLAGWLLAPMLRFVESHLAVEQILQQRTRTALTVGVLVVAVSNGLGLGNAVMNNVDDVRQWYRRTMAGDLFLMNPAAESTAAESEKSTVHDRLTRQPGVETVVELRYLQTRANGMPAVCLVRDFRNREMLPWSTSGISEASVRSRLLAGETVLSNSLARRLKIEHGDDVRLELQGRTHVLRVAALVSDYTLGGMAAYLDQQAASQLLQLGPPNVYLIHVRPSTPESSLLPAIQSLAEEEGMVLQTFSQLRRGLDQMINGVVGSLWTLIGVGFVVGGIAVGNTLTMSVLERTRELGLLRIVGMTRWQIRRLVFCESILLGIAGCVMGIVSGITTAWIIHLCTQPLTGRVIPFAFHLTLLVANVIGCMVVSMASAWLPSERAARLDLRAAASIE